MSELSAILRELETVLARVPAAQIDDFTGEVLAAPRIFVVGEGRSGLMAKAFAMRLMHLGLDVYAVGETITPAVRAGETLIALSGSGTTRSVLLVAEAAAAAGARVVVVTTNPESPLALASARVLHLPAATKYRREGEAPSIQPLGSLFDQCAHLLFDAVCLRVASQKEAGAGALARHSNVE